MNDLLLTEFLCGVVQYIMDWLKNDISSNLEPGDIDASQPALRQVKYYCLLLWHCQMNSQKWWLHAILPSYFALCFVMLYSALQYSVLMRIAQ